MSSRGHGFKRLVLGLRPGPSHPAVKLGVQLADVLQIDLLGLFLDDANLRQLAGIPFARELRSLGGGWQPIESDRLTRELELAARNTERLFVEAARPLGARGRFEVMQAVTAEAVTSVSRADDIVMISDPSRFVDPQQFLSFSRAALQSDASIMFAPPCPARSSGPVVAIAPRAGDPSVDVAAAIAVAAGEDLIVVGEGASGTFGRSEGKSSVHARVHVQRTYGFGDARALDHALQDLRERLLVCTRGGISDDTARSLAALRRLPVLLIGPARASAAQLMK
jgi:hypothetical protein